jgi:hypothetical protein
MKTSVISIGRKIAAPLASVLLASAKLAAAQSRTPVRRLVGHHVQPENPRLRRQSAAQSDRPGAVSENQAA